MGWLIGDSRRPKDSQDDRSAGVANVAGPKVIELQLSGGGNIRLEVECIDAGLADVSGEWAALGRPQHPDEN